MGNWDNKEKLKQRALAHSKEMDAKYHEEIMKAVAGTAIYPPAKAIVTYPSDWCKVKVLEMDSVSAIFEKKGFRKKAVLNFASYKNPGGMFMAGSKAQEEMLCHESYLYNVLREFEDDFYIPNRSRLNHALYNDNLLYSPNIRFMRGGKTELADVITCAAPNKYAAQKYQSVSDDIVNIVMRERIRRILNRAVIALF